MKRIFLISLIMVLTGCSTCGEFWKHDTVWKDWDHACKSNFGTMDRQDVEKGWWGCPVEVKK